MTEEKTITLLYKLKWENKSEKQPNEEDKTSNIYFTVFLFFKSLNSTPTYLLYPHLFDLKLYPYLFNPKPKFNLKFKNLN